MHQTKTNLRKTNAIHSTILAQTFHR
ncbi:hypothetical protein M3J09_008144 [Ascochyta lentis]